MNQSKDDMLRRYNARFAKFGCDPRSLGWSNGRQTVRFVVLSGIGKIDGSSVLDVGCGFGDLYGFYKTIGINVRYTGIDINPNFINVARKRYPDAKFQVTDIDNSKIKRKNFDWVFATGVFEFRRVNMERVVRHTIAKMFELAEKGVAVDFLTRYVDFMQKDNFHATPEHIFKFAKTLSKRVALRHDYMPYEFCIYIYKDEQINKRNVFATFDMELIKRLGTNELFPPGR